MVRPVSFDCYAASTPAAGTEYNSQKGTPRCAKFGDETHAGGPAETQVVFKSHDLQALALAHVTRMGQPGQRTGRVSRTQERAGADVFIETMKRQVRA